MHIEGFAFGSIRIDGKTYDYDVVIHRGEIRKQKKKASKCSREEFGHTPLSIEEPIPWNCKWLMIGTGANGAMPVMKEVREKAARHKVELLVMPTEKSIEHLNPHPEGTKHYRRYRKAKA